jgi:hypothetical protein
MQCKRNQEFLLFFLWILYMSTGIYAGDNSTSTYGTSPTMSLVYPTLKKKLNKSTISRTIGQSQPGCISLQK